VNLPSKQISEDVFLQLLKDLTLAGFQMSDAPGFENGYDYLFDFFQVQLKSAPTNLRRFLYTADITESTIANKVTSHIPAEAAAQLLALALERMQIKIELRKKFS
jgi:hypothetical protein